MSTVVDLQKRIIGGKQCGLKERRYHVKLLSSNVTHEMLCGASLISDQWILTAAHCHEPGWTMYAVLGVHPGPGEEVQIKEPPEIYTDSNKRTHDIMLLKLPEAKLKLPKIQPIALPASPCSHPPEGEKVQIAGHAATTGGPNDERIPDESPDLQCVDIDIVSCQNLRQNMQTRDPNHRWLYQHWFCGQSPRVDVCHGDSGGGVVYKNKIYGVISLAGDRDHVCTQPAAFMDICNQEYLKWIKNTIKKP